MVVGTVIAVNTRVTATGSRVSPALGSLRRAVANGWRLVRGAVGYALIVLAVAALVGLVPVLYLVLVGVVIPAVILFGLTRVLYWLAARLAAYAAPESAGPYHRWPRMAIWLVALGAGAVVAWIAVNSRILWEAYASAVTTPVGTALSPIVGKMCATWLASTAREIVDWVVATPAPSWPLLVLTLVAAVMVRGHHEAEAVRVAAIDAMPAR
jgi:hypothetical protein